MSPTRYLINAQVFSPLISLAIAAGANERDLFRGTSLNGCDDKTLLTRAEQIRFLNNLLACCDLTNMGTAAGLMADFKNLGILGLVMLSAPSLKRAVEIGAQYAALGGDLGGLMLWQEGETLALEAHYPPFAPALEQLLVEEQFVSLQIYAATLMGEQYHPLNGRYCIADKIQFTHPAPDNLSSYEQLFKCQVEFNQQHNRFYYTAKLLGDAPLLANTTASEMCLRLCANQLADITEQEPLITSIRALLLEDSSKVPSLDELALALGLTTRALRHRIAALGTSYKVLLAETRYDIAIELLADKRLSISQVGERLGYSEATNFRRAFKRWSGLSPNHYRRVNPKDSQQ